jgi:hypothetical protein
VLDKVEITNSRGNILSLPMEEDEGGYQVAQIEGLDPVKATLVSTSFVGSDGEQFQSAKRPARNIKIKLDLDPDFDPKTYTDLRKDLYPFFMPKAEISLRFFLSSGLYLDIVGIVEEMSAPLFEQDPTVDISVMCYQPDFVDGRMVTVNGMSVNSNTNIEIDYPGTVESGTVITINFNRDVDEFTIYNMDEGGKLYQLDFSGELLDGDQLVISSLRGNKGITLLRDSVTTSFLYGRSAQSSWIEFVEGLNQFRVYAEGDPIPYVLTYVVRYGGL